MSGSSTRTNGKSTPGTAGRRTRKKKGGNAISEKKSDPTILVVGDLFIDENWLMALCDYYHSTNVGNEHFTSRLLGPDSRIFSVCGIANVVKILGGKPEKGNNPLMNWRFVCVAVWNPRDNDLLRCFLCREGPNLQSTPYTLTGLQFPDRKNPKGTQCAFRPNEKCVPTLEMRNLVTDDARECSSTNRLYRIYEGFGSDRPRLRLRYDWHLRPDEDMLQLSQLKDVPGDVRAVILVDHGYGVVTPKIVQGLLEHHRSVPWYVRTKLANPKWLTYLKSKKKRLRLLVIDEQLVKHQYGIRIRRHGKKLGRGSLEVLSDMLGLYKYEHLKQQRGKLPIADNAAILFEDDSAIAGSRLAGGRKASLVSLPAPHGEIQPIRVGRTSVFFNSLVHWDLCPEEDNLSEDTIYSATTWALDNMRYWTKSCTAGWMAEKPDELAGPFHEVLGRSKSEARKKKNEGQVQFHEQSWQEWNDSSSNLGTIWNSTDKVEELQMWRSFGTLPNYICPGGEKRSAINNLVQELDRYKKEKDPEYPFNCLFLAEPGWGKSYLAKCLCKHFDFAFLEYSLAQMSSTKDLMDCFKVIVSTQKRTERKVLVFMDELDADIQGHPALSLLLGPMWDGMFRVDGNANKIDPCVWVFASTKPTELLLKEINKARDFLSRINGPTINLDYLKDGNRVLVHSREDEGDRENRLKEIMESHGSLGTELVYHGVHLLNRRYGPVTNISVGVLRRFYEIWPIHGMRSMITLVSRFSGIVGGKVHESNMPSEKDVKDDAGLRRHIRKVNRELSKDTKYQKRIGDKDQLVKILFRP